MKHILIILRILRAISAVGFLLSVSRLSYLFFLGSKNGSQAIKDYIAPTFGLVVVFLGLFLSFVSLIIEVKSGGNNE